MPRVVYGRLGPQGCKVRFGPGRVQSENDSGDSILLSSVGTVSYFRALASLWSIHPWAARTLVDCESHVGALSACFVDESSFEVNILEKY